jgi:hypothetical protein
VLFGEDGDRLEFAEYSFYLLNGCLAEDHIELFSIFHEDDVIIFEHGLIALYVFEALLQLVHSRVELFAE